MDLKKQTIEEAVLGDDVTYNVVMDVTSYKSNTVDGKRVRVTDKDGNPVIDWSLSNVKGVISYAQCPMRKVFEIANRYITVMIQRARVLPKEEFLETMKTPFYVRDYAERKPGAGIGGALKSINTMADNNDEEGLKRIESFLKEKIAELQKTKPKK